MRSVRKLSEERSLLPAERWGGKPPRQRAELAETWEGPVLRVKDQQGGGWMRACAGWEEPSSSGAVERVAFLPRF